MNAAAWDYYEAMMARTIQMEEYFTTGKVSTNFSELVAEVAGILRIMEIEKCVSDRNAFYIRGTDTIH